MTCVFLRDCKALKSKGHICIVPYSQSSLKDFLNTRPLDMLFYTASVIKAMKRKKKSLTFYYVPNEKIVFALEK